MKKTKNNLLCAAAGLAFLVSGCGKPPAPAAGPQLSVDNVIGWKVPYGRYLGKNISEVTRALGKPDTYKTVKKYSYLEYKNRETSRIVGFSYLTARPLVKNIYISSTGNEGLDVNKVLVKAGMFKFYSGKYVDSTEQYFSAEDGDGNSLQFTIEQSSLTFRRLIVGKENF